MNRDLGINRWIVIIVLLAIGIALAYYFSGSGFTTEGQKVRSASDVQKTEAPNQGR
ncbi:MAG: hypothetical protein AKCLJLPJ_01973 [Fimbriimonadales bacterium]|nr:hypothetical protein [Fimbriimonadales bacterium]NOG93775.1 hypothetical protein [Armatimonadota bacterium]